MRAEEYMAMTAEDWAAQLYSEFREFFPNNAVEYFVS